MTTAKPETPAPTKRGLAIDLTTNQIDYSNPKVLQVIKESIAPDATPAEFAYFLAYCQSTNLNPLKKECWFIKTKPYTKNNGDVVEGKVQIMTGINGAFTIANSYPEYDGLEIETAYDESGSPVESVARAWRKDRRLPSIGKARWTEDSGDVKSFHGKPTVWGTRKTTMLEKVAKMRALREAFPQKLGNVYLQEEFDAESRTTTPSKSKESAAELDKLLAAPAKPNELSLKSADELSEEQMRDEEIAQLKLQAEEQ